MFTLTFNEANLKSSLCTFIGLKTYTKLKSLKFLLCDFAFKARWIVRATFLFLVIIIWFTLFQHKVICLVLVIYYFSFLSDHSGLLLQEGEFS